METALPHWWYATILSPFLTTLDTHLLPLSLSAGIIRSLACAENWIAVGNYNGMINALDFRTGELLGTWKPSDFAPMLVSNECQVNCSCLACIVTCNS